MMGSLGLNISSLLANFTRRERRGAQVVSSPFHRQDVVGDDEEGGTGLLFRGEHQIIEVGHPDRVQTGVRFVEEHDLGIRHHGAGQAGPLLHPAGHLTGELLQVVQEADQLGIRSTTSRSPARSYGCAREAGRRCCRRGSSIRTVLHPERARRTSAGSRRASSPAVRPSGYRPPRSRPLPVATGPKMFLSRTDLPVPDGPRMAVIFPLGTSKVMSSSTVLVPNRLVTPRTEMMGSPGAIHGRAPSWAVPASCALVSLASACVIVSPRCRENVGSAVVLCRNGHFPPSAPKTGAVNEGTVAATLGSWLTIGRGGSNDGREQGAPGERPKPPSPGPPCWLRSGSGRAGSGTGPGGRGCACPTGPSRPRCG